MTDMRARIEDFIRRHELIPPGGEVTCLVSAGPDSTCLWHVLRGLGYRVSALHVNYGLRGEESEEDARFCREVLGAEVVEGRPTGSGSEDELREIRYSFVTDQLRATGHTASDQVETILYRLAARGAVSGIKPKREDGVVRPLLEIWRAETEAYCRDEGLEFRIDTSNPDTKRGLIREEILPLLRQLHPDAEANLARLAQLETAPPELSALHRRPRIRHRLDRAHAPQARGRGALGPVAHLRGGKGAYSAGVASRRPARGAQEEDPGRVRGREDPKIRARSVAARRARRRGRGRARDRRGGGRVVESRLSQLQADAVEEILIDEEALQARVAELGQEISTDYEGQDLLLVGVLKGAVFFMADLMRHISLPCEVDFMAISSYGAGSDSSGVVRILKDLDINIKDRNVLVLEDIIDSGLTLSYLMRSLGAREPASVEACALLVKHGRREADVPVRYVGFEIPNRYVVGYGLDFAERYRNLPHVAVLRDELARGL